MNETHKPAPTPFHGYSAIAVRFGDSLLEAGHTAIPNAVLDSYARLGLTPAEMLFVVHVWQFWWTHRNPYPSLARIADRMDMSRRQMRSYVSSLRSKGFLVVHERHLAGMGQATSEYD